VNEPPAIPGSGRNKGFGEDAIKVPITSPRSKTKALNNLCWDWIDSPTLAVVGTMLLVCDRDQD
jgi:hypothetical protein